MSYESLEDARAAWESGDEVHVRELDDDVNTTLVVTDQEEGYALLRYWQTPKGEWVCSVDETRSILRDVFESYDNALEMIGGVA